MAGKAVGILSVNDSPKAQKILLTFNIQYVYVF